MSSLYCLKTQGFLHLQGPVSADAGAGAVSREDVAAVLAGVLAAPPSGRREVCLLMGVGTVAGVPVREQLESLLAAEQPPA